MATTRRFTDGAVIFNQGDLSGTVYLVETGQVRITRTTRAGEVVALGSVGPRCIFGEMALIDSTQRMATATAVGATSCLVADATLLHQQLEQLSGAALQVYHDMLGYIRGTLPFEARPPAQQNQGETDKDRAARALLLQLPTVLAALEDAPLGARTLLEVLAQYVQRRLPPLST